MSSAGNHDEVKLARALASPSVIVRDKAVIALEEYITGCELTEVEMLKLWKALFYCFWYSDKVPAQQELAKVLAGFVHKFNKASQSLLYFRMFLRTILREWHFIDQYRINKYYDLIRYVLREVFRFLQDKHNWNSKKLGYFLAVLEEEILSKTPNGVRFHVAEIVVGEIGEVTGGSISEKSFTACVQPFLGILESCTDNAFVDRVIEKVFIKFLHDRSSGEQSVTSSFTKVPLKCVQALIFNVASEETTRQANRQKIYELHRKFQRAAKFCSQEAEVETEAIVPKKSATSSLKRKPEVVAAGGVDAVKKKKKAIR